jgi:hypothetical protein
VRSNFAAFEPEIDWVLLAALHTAATQRSAAGKGTRLSISRSR